MGFMARTSSRRRKRVVFVAAAIFAAMPVKALASAGCDQVNAGAWNTTLNSGRSGARISGFDYGDTLHFTVTGTGLFVLNAPPSGSGPVKFTEVLAITPPGSASYTIVPPHVRFETFNEFNKVVSGPINITATCTPSSNSATPQSATKGFLLSRLNAILLNDPGNTSLLNRSTAQAGPTIVASSAPIAGNTAAFANGIPPAMALGASRIGEGGSGTAGLQTAEFATSLSQMRRQARGAQAERYRMALGAGDGGSLPLVYETPALWDVWVEGRFSGFNDDAGNLDRDGHVGVLYAGADYRISPDMIVGALVQFDWSKEDSPVLASKVDGNGWMAGPYLSARVHESIYVDVRAAWGRSTNDLTLATTTGGFDTSRWLVKGALAGNWLYDSWRLTPSAELAYVTERQDAFTDSADTFMPGQSVSLGRLQFGPEVGYRFARSADMAFEPFAALRGVWDFDNPNVAIIDGIVVGPGDFWGRLEGGLTLLTREGVAVRGLASWDGVGASNYSGYTLQGTLNVPLN